MDERSEVKSAKRSFASNWDKFWFWREASLRAFCFVSLSQFYRNLCGQLIGHFSRNQYFSSLTVTSIQRLNFANGYPQAGHGLQEIPSVSAHDTLSAMNPVSVSTPSVLDPATQLGHLNAAITKLEPQIPPPSFPTSSSPHHQPLEQRLPMTPPRPNPMEPLVESFYEKDVEEELEEHFKKSQSETKKRKGKSLVKGGGALSRNRSVHFNICGGGALIPL